MWADVTNGLFEMCGGLLVLNHCRAVLRDKAVAGVSILSTAIFTLWGVWNVYYRAANFSITTLIFAIVATVTVMFLMDVATNNHASPLCQHRGLEVFRIHGTNLCRDPNTGAIFTPDVRPPDSTRNKNDGWN